MQPERPRVKSGPVTMMVTERVKPDKVEQYEEWLSGIHDSAQTFKGFLGVQIIRPNDPSNLEYLILVEFDSAQHLDLWNHSEECARWLDKLPEMLSERPHRQHSQGLEMWFSRPAVSSRTKAPYFKQVTVGIISVYPLLLVVSYSLGPFTKDLPKPVALLISVFIVSGLLTYPVMPTVTAALAPWLYAPAKS